LFEKNEKALREEGLSFSGHVYTFSIYLSAKDPYPGGVGFAGSTLREKVIRGTHILKHYRGFDLIVNRENFEVCTQKLSKKGASGRIGSPQTKLPEAPGEL
jgi:hypothetical protein